jgi:hypothetical protein
VTGLFGWGENRLEKQKQTEQKIEDPRQILSALGRRHIKVIGGPTLGQVETLIRDWLQEGHYVRHLQVDHLPNQPECERWQAIITYYLNDAAVRPPKRRCYRCTTQNDCQRYQTYLIQKTELAELLPEDFPD